MLSILQFQASGFRALTGAYYSREVRVVISSTASHGGSGNVPQYQNPLQL